MVKDFEFSSKLHSLKNILKLDENSLLFLFHNDKILGLGSESHSTPLTFCFNSKDNAWKHEIAPFLQKLNITTWDCIKYGRFHEYSTYLLYFDGDLSSLYDKISNQDNIGPEDLFLKPFPIRYLIRAGMGNKTMIAGIAFQIYTWLINHRFCGRCGNKTIHSTKDFALLCPKCNQTEFPRLSPAVIVAIRKNSAILLAHNSNFPPDFYSVIAGFVNPGENLEDAIYREVKEEIGISIKNIEYFSSQPWPFPNSLMLAFTAEWEAGEICVDNHEIVDAKWFSVDDLPQIPSTLSVARKLIDHFVSMQTNKNKF